MEMFLPLGTGGNINIVTRDEARDGHLLAQLIESADATVIQGTPATFQLLLDSGWRGKRTEQGRERALRILCGGEEMPGELAADLRQMPGWCGAESDFLGHHGLHEDRRFHPKTGRK